MIIQTQETQNPPPWSSEELRAHLECVDDLSLLPDDWDDEGGKAPSLPVREYTKALLLGIAEALWNHAGTHIFMPKIHPGPGDTIDILWEWKGTSLLLNAGNGRAAYAGEKRNGQQIRGEISELKALTCIGLFLQK